jgi:type IV pilus assembly protein PilE
MAKHNRGQNHGFSLVELLVVVAVVAILAAVAYPTYREQVASGHRADMQAELMRLAQYMERLYTETGCYNPGSDNDCASGTAAAPTITTTSDYYSVSFPAAPTGNPTENTFTIQATPNADSAQAGNGILQINHLGQQFWDENGDNDVTDADEDNWVRQ